MAKTFQPRASKTPRSAETDPAYRAAAAAAEGLGLGGPASHVSAGDAPAIPVGGPPEAPAPTGAAAVPPEELVQPKPPPLMPVAPVLPDAAIAVAPAASSPSPIDGAASAEPLDPRDAKVTIYPPERELRHLRDLSVHGRVAKSIIAEYALEMLFQTQNDEQIVGELRARGHGLRKKRGT